MRVLVANVVRGAVVALLATVVGCHPKAGPNVADAAPDASDARVAAGRTDAGDGTAPLPAAAATVATADDALPPFVSDELTLRARHLLEAIQKDDGDLAADLVFPRDAYLVVKDVPDPGKHWDSKVLAAFRSQVHALHKRTKGIERATFTGFDLGQPASEALPKKHDLKRMLWRARRSRLGFSIDGKPSHFDIVELTGWRGSWYVTRLR